jgi:hypothetical protein
LDSVCKHMTKLKEDRGFDRVHAKALTYATRSSFEAGSPNDYHAAHKKGWLDQVCSHMESRHTNWTKELLQQDALRFTTRTDFAKQSTGYNAAWKMGILDEICGHMEVKLTYWTDEELAAEALKHTTKTEFSNASSSAYVAAHKRGLIPTICSHMKDSVNTSVAELSLFNYIKSIYPTTKKIRDMTVKIQDKPHIHGFDIDIYTPELRKGIEFDGKYWHSTEALKNQKPHWPLEDVENYHQLKDSWFASKGIQVLHIKEEDWIKDKEECIKKCLEFLGSNNDLPTP